MTVFLAESRQLSSTDIWKSDSFRKPEDLKDCALHYRGAVFLHEVLWFMSVSPGIVDGHVR